LTYEILRREFDVWWPDLKSKLDEIAEMSDGVTGTGFDWLYTADDLAKIQSDDDCKCVWYVTPNLYRNALATKIKDAIQRNIERAVSYTFIIPASDEMDLIAESLKRMAVSKPSQIRINDQTSKEEFRKLAVTDYIILNADSDEVQVFLELPITARGYWIKVDDEAAVGLVVRFRKLANMDTAS
jgi:hypothetical protein